jgi:hypothetical protein
MRTLAVVFAGLLLAACGEDPTPIRSCGDLTLCTQDCPVAIERSEQITCEQVESNWRITLAVTHRVTNQSESDLTEIGLYSQFKGENFEPGEYSPADSFFNIHQGIWEYYHVIDELEAGQSINLIYQVVTERTETRTQVEDLSVCVPDQVRVVVEGGVVDCP